MNFALRLLPCLAFSAALHAQSTWYVDAQAAPPGDGSLATPFRSIQYAHDQIATLTGDTLSVAAGVYVENLSLSKRVRIVASSGPAATTLRAATPGDLVSVTAADQFPFATLRGFTLAGDAFPAGTGLHVDNTSFAVLQIERCVVRGFSAGRAIALGGNGYLEARQTTVWGNAIGVQVEPAVSNGIGTFVGCILRGNANELLGTEDGYLAFYSDVAPAFSGGAGQHNVSADPAFWDASNGDLHLRPNSPCIDGAGPGFPLDPDGSVADMGAFAFEPSYGWSTYCTSGLTSSGCSPSISASGVPSASAPSGFVINVVDVEGQRQGHAFYGLNGANSVAWGASSHFLCVKAPSQRTGTQDSGGTSGACDGVIQLDWCAYLASHPAALGAPFSSGVQVWAQLYFRDPPGPKTTALSNALTFVVVP